jgi:hypothetical protein
MELVTSITNDDVSSTAESFAVVRGAFIRFIQQHANEDGEGIVDHIILIGHYGKELDVPFLIYQLAFLIYQLGVHGIDQTFIQDGRFHVGMDTLQIARQGICDDKQELVCQLPTICQLCFNL